MEKKKRYSREEERRNSEQKNRLLAAQTVPISSIELANEVEQVLQDQPGYIRNLVMKLSNENKKIMVDYISKEESNHSPLTKEGRIKRLCYLALFNGNKNFRKLTNNDILNHLSDGIKSQEEDTFNKWKGYWNERVRVFSKFFRWLHFPTTEDNCRLIAPCMQGIKLQKRKEVTVYSIDDLWDEEDVTTFLKWCPHPRDRCYVAMAALDTSARPHELLGLKVGDVEFRNSREGIIYTILTLNSGKTGRRQVPIIKSVPYLKEWLTVHPLNTNLQAPLFVSFASRVRVGPLTRDGLLTVIQDRYRKSYFPRLLQRVDLSSEDKIKIEKLLARRWNLYIYRHSGLTNKAHLLKELELREHAGWTMNAKQYLRYIKRVGESSCEAILSA
ncbi:MAG: hypothetical protein ACRD5H_04900, partial [Nitrososphaerales archaeon]